MCPSSRHDPGVRHVQRSLHRRLVRRRRRAASRAPTSKSAAARRAAGADDRRIARRPKRATASWSASAREASPGFASGSPPRTAWRSAGAPRSPACHRLHSSPPVCVSPAKSRLRSLAATASCSSSNSTRMTGEPISDLRQSPSGPGCRSNVAPLVVGSGARQLVDARGWGEAREAWPVRRRRAPAARSAPQPGAQAGLRPRPRCARHGSGVMATIEHRRAHRIGLVRATSTR